MLTDIVFLFGMELHFSFSKRDTNVQSSSGKRLTFNCFIFFFKSLQKCHHHLALFWRVMGRRAVLWKECRESFSFIPVHFAYKFIARGSQFKRYRHGCWGYLRDKKCNCDNRGLFQSHRASVESNEIWVKSNWNAGVLYLLDSNLVAMNWFQLLLQLV